jgi:beta-glucosidase
MKAPRQPSTRASINFWTDREPKNVLDKGLISEKEIDENLRGVFRVMIRLGLLDSPSAVRYATIHQHGNASAPWDSEEHKRVAREVTESSIALLKNADGLLLLSRNSIHSMAVFDRGLMKWIWTGTATPHRFKSHP